MTEDEAKTKWCVQSQATETPFKCDASACMAWRWDLDGFDLDFDEAGPVRVRKTKLAHGHCGLAGRP